MAEFREPIPIISGPGAVLVALIFIALILTSEESRILAFNWQFAVALVAISFPISVLITQVYHAFYTKFGYRKKNWGEKYARYKKNMHKLDAMADYLIYEKGAGEKGWVIIQKKATAYHFSGMLLCVSFLFIPGYTIFLILACNGLFRHFHISWWGVVFTYGIATFCTILFWLARKVIWEAYMLLDRKIIKGIESCLDAWAKDEIKEDGGKK